MKKRLTTIITCLLVFITISIHAQTSNLSIQGVLRNSNGTAVENGTYNITFKLYSETIPDSIVWEDTMEDVEVEGGIYSVILGSGNKELNAAFDQPYTLGVSIENGTELIPRAKLTSSPYALSLIGADNIFPNSGNVGVGAASPQHKLTVGRGQNTLGLEVDSMGSNSALIVTKPDGLKFSTAAEAYYFEGDGNEVMRIKKDGKVGLGTVDPQSTLHVVGENDQIKVEGTNDANIVFTKTTGSATLGFDAAGGDDLKLSNPIGTTKIEGNNITLNPTSGTATIEGNTAVNGTVGVTKEGEALQLIGGSNTNLAFYPTGLAGGKKASIGVASNNQFLLNTTNSDIMLSPGSGKRVQTTGMLHATGNEQIYISESNHIWERYTSSGYATRQNGRNYDLSIYANSGIRAHEFVIASDKRIKKDFSLSNGQEDLLTLLKIKVTDYRHIDEVAKGIEMKKGVIAQDVKAVFPEAINMNDDFIPNVFDFPSMLSSENGKLKVQLNKDHDFKAGDKVKIGTLEGNQEVIVSTVNSPQEFVIDNWQGSTKKEELFVYGKEVNDFHTVDYDRIFTLNVSATQELARRVEALEKENALLKSNATKTKDLLKNLSAKVEALESTFEMTGSR